MLFVTGDCHGDFRRFSALRFPWQKLLTKEDFCSTKPTVRNRCRYAEGSA